MNGSAAHVVDSASDASSDRGALGGLEAVKWFAFLLMVVDHVNGYLLPQMQPVLFLVGRLVFPLFALALAFGLAGRGAHSLDITVRRLFIWACVSQVPWAMFDHTAGLNVLFTLLAGALLYQAVFVRRLGWARYSLTVLAVIFSQVMEFGFGGLLLVFGALWFAESRSPWALGVGVFGLASLQTVNGTWFALAAPGVFWVLHRYVSLPRLRHAFYWMYPAHLAVLGFLRFWL